MQLFHKKNGKKSLIIFFSGWALDFTPFAHLFSNEHDLLFVWDYRNTDFNFDFSGYEKICAAAFSYGVFMSSFAKLPPLESFSAINGTLCPYSKEFGINPRIFELTLNSLNSNTLLKFYQNMFSTQEEYEEFTAFMPKNPDIAALKAELANIKTLSETNTPNSTFTKVVIAQNDRIIPTKSQKNYWCNKTPIKQVNCGHFPFFKYKMDELI